GVVRVPQDEPTISAGISEASPGDTVLIASGTYDEHSLNVTKGITIAGAADHPDSVTIDGGGTDQIMHIMGADGSVVRGITFTNGRAFLAGAVRCDTSGVDFESCAFTDNYSTYIAGALYLENASRETQTFNNCTFSGNYAEGSGGAVWLEYGAAVFTNCTFDQNDAEFDGGAVAVSDEATVTFTDCVFDGNDALDGYGGALDIGSDGSLALTGCTFTGNKAYDGDGGAVYVNPGTHADISSCDFVGNWAEDRSGAVSLDELPHISVTDCGFESNTTDREAAALDIDESNDITFERNAFVGHTGTGGAAVIVYNSPMTFTDCLFAGNTANWGGALEIWNSDPTTIHGCTFTGNEMTGFGGAPAITIYSTSGGDPTITFEYCSISENIGGEPIYESDGVANLSCSTVWGNPSGDWVGPIAGQGSVNGNMSEDPLFCDPESGDYRLCADSPCLPENNPECTELIGAYEAGCPECGTAVEPVSWGSIKAIFR
ncbi:MAG: hypothetical protein GF405_03695, partial [Candidatus Eisenbacteria bacterium]|nr:hypothetical protein [Candidatus Eisenbacteria bacterium]